MDKKVSAIIIDDEVKLSEVLKLKLNQFCPSIKVCGVAKNIQEGKSLILKTNPDLFFLDIAMPGGSGFKLLELFDEISFEIIFVTGYSDYALDALKVSAVDYLLKPIKGDVLIEAVNKAIKKIEVKENDRRYHLLKHNIEHLNKQSSKIAIPGSQSYDFIYVKDIIRCEGEQKYTYIHTVKGSSILSSYNIGVYKEMLSNYSFFSTHKSHLINIEHIEKYLPEGVVVMSDESNVPVSRRKKDEFLKEVLGK